MSRFPAWLILLLFAGVGVLAFVGMNRSFGAHAGKDQAEKVYAEFLRKHVASDGRVIDNGNAGISHSEGQGYAMMFAARLGDQVRFDQIARWTEANLSGRSDGLLSWCWEPAGGGGRITDPNNATDGDMLVAWAYLMAFDRWHRQEDRAAAHRHLQAIADHALADTDYGPVLLPGAEGFVHEDRIVLNLSYWIYPALRRFEQADPNGPWRALRGSGLKLTETASFGEYSLAPDWIELRPDRVSPADGWPPEFGFNAIRVPIHLCGEPGAAGEARPDPLLASYARYFADRQDDLTTQWDILTDQPAGYLAEPGYRAVASFVASGCRQIDEPSGPSDKSYYYDDALKGLTMIVLSGK